MNTKKRGLNRGLDVLLAGTGILGQTNSSDNYSVTRNILDNQESSNLLTSAVEQISIDKLSPGKFQPRSLIEPEELNDLVQSIKKHGILQPLIIRRSQHNYEIIAGERRWRAATIAGLNSVPAIVKAFNDQEALTVALIENIQRENLNPLEEALALNRLIQEFSLTHNEVAIAVGKSRTTITNLLRILQLPTEIQTMLSKKQLELGHAKVLAGQPYDLQIKLANKVLQDNLSVRSTEKVLKKYLNKFSVDPENKSKTISSIPGNKTIDPDIYRLQQHLSDFFSTKVSIEFNQSSKRNPAANKYQGKLIINYSSLEELEGILAHCGCDAFEM